MSLRWIKLVLFLGLVSLMAAQGAGLLGDEAVASESRLVRSVHHPRIIIIGTHAPQAIGTKHDLYQPVAQQYNILINSMNHPNGMSNPADKSGTYNGEYQNLGYPNAGPSIPYNVGYGGGYQNPAANAYNGMASNGYNGMPGMASNGYNGMPGMASNGFNGMPGMASNGFNRMPGMASNGYNGVSGYGKR